MIFSHDGFLYACVKTLHNLAIDHDDHRNRMIKLKVLDLMDAIISRFHEKERLVEWCYRAVEAISNFDNPAASHKEE